MKSYTEDEVKKLAQKGKDDPASLTHDELQAVCLYAHHKAKKRLAVWDGEKMVPINPERSQ